ncbi:PASTA domain-containing protein [Micromonospora sp. NPDC000316]|uniref:PASTA domain-containing protein n=1 Tax=Micromonospora sp. NPDC000316 TaxID=3364216 RepID=UPI0036904411
MSDDRQEPPTGEPDDDRTRALPPPADQPRPPVPGASPDETMPIDRAAAAGHTPSPDATAPIDRSALPDATMPIDRAASPDETMPIDRAALGQPGDRTARMPVERSTTTPWAGRAEVRAPRPAEPSEGWYVEEQGGRRWWMPILWGVLALVFAGLLGAALWVVLNARDDDPDGPGPTPSLPPATTAAPTSAAPTSAAPTSATPSSPPTSAAPEEVPMPPLTGLAQDTAEGLLDRLGLTYRVVYRPSELPPGTVVSTEPEAGTPVSTDDEVLLVISQDRPSTGSSPASASPTVTSTP